ncbi:MAG: PQQ-binding-like beta-propeller repeat protein [Candidatus Aureabacteria bacterium]|nr:PQQ-binding-like beta-propeller repeat protein [Candidatus Auribacterota bacterium]
MKKTLLVISALVLASLITCFAQLQPNSPWPMFHHDARHTGQSEYAGPSLPMLNWSYMTGDWIDPSPSIGSDGKVYIGSEDANFYAFISTGLLAWSYATGRRVDSSAAIGSDGGVYVGSGDKNLYIMNSNGSLSWSYVTGNDVESSPVLGSDGRIFIGSDDNKIYALNPNGSLDWSYGTGWFVSACPALGSGVKVYFGSWDNNIYALNSNGSLNWSYGTMNYISCTPTLGSDETVYASSEDYNFYAVTSNGLLDWSYLTGSIPASPSLGSDGGIYVDSNYLYALTSTGLFNWSYKANNDGITFSSLALGNDGMVYVRADSYYLYSFNSTGSFSWSYKTASVVVSSPALGSDRRIYFGSWDNNVYCLSQGSTPTVTPTQPTPTPTHTPTVTPTHQPTEMPSSTPTSPPSTSTATPVPPAENVLNGISFKVGEQLVATFKVNVPIETPFDVYAVLILPNGRMLNARTLDRPVRPLARKVKKLPAGFTYQLMSKTIPTGAPKGEYELAVIFFDATKPYRTRADAFLDVSSKFTIQ